MVVNNSGDLEMYAIHDTPKQAPWSARGDLAIGAGKSYKIIYGFHDSEPPPEPWDISTTPNPQPPESVSRSDQTREESIVRGRSKHASFGRGDEDGFPALAPNNGSAPANLATTKPGKSRTYSPASFRKYHSAERSTIGKDQPLRDIVADQLGQTNGESSRSRNHRAQREKSASKARKQPMKIIQQVVEDDISMVMRNRAIRGYGLNNVQLFN